MFGCEVGPMSIFSQALAGLARLSSFQHRFVFVKKLNANRLVRPLCAAIALGASLVSAGAQIAPPASLQQRLQAIFDMSAEDMAATSAFTKRAYEAQLAHIYRIQNKQIRDIVLEFVLNPKATAFEQAATQSWLASPGSGWRSHHAYPGGLSVHNLEWVEVALGWSDTWEKVYGVKLDRDLIVAGLILHDWGKLWFLFDDGSGKIREPDWYPKAWGTKANWKWMGGHGAVLYAELIARGIPTDLLFSAASAHFDPYWALEKDGEGMNPALREAAEIAKKPAPVVKPEERMGKGWRRLIACVLLTFSVEASHAHQHIWVTMKCQIIFGADGSIVGVRHAWSFDEMSSAYITLGTGNGQKGIFSPEKLASLAEAQVASLKSSDYFTSATVNGIKQQFEPSADYRLESVAGVLTLHFTLPFRSPLTGQTLELEIYDPSYFVDISFAKQEPVELVNPPTRCKFAITPQTWTQVANKIAVTCP